MYFNSCYLGLLLVGIFMPSCIIHAPNQTGNLYWAISGSAQLKVNSSGNTGNLTQIFQRIQWAISKHWFKKVSITDTSCKQYLQYYRTPLGQNWLNHKGKASRTIYIFLTKFSHYIIIFYSVSLRAWYMETRGYICIYLRLKSYIHIYGH